MEMRSMPTGWLRCIDMSTQWITYSNHTERIIRNILCSNRNKPKAHLAAHKKESKNLSLYTRRSVEPNQRPFPKLHPLLQGMRDGKTTPRHETEQNMRLHRYLGPLAHPTCSRHTPAPEQVYLVLEICTMSYANSDTAWSIFHEHCPNVWCGRDFF